MRTMLDSDEFWDATNFRAKAEIAARNGGQRGARGQRRCRLPQSRWRTHEQLGEPLYRKQEPTGYTNRGSDWLNSASLLARMNFANDSGAGQSPGRQSGPDPVHRRPAADRTQYSSRRMRRRCRRPPFRPVSRSHSKHIEAARRTDGRGTHARFAGFSTKVSGNKEAKQCRFPDVSFFEIPPSPWWESDRSPLWLQRAAFAESDRRPAQKNPRRHLPARRRRRPQHRSSARRTALLRPSPHHRRAAPRGQIATEDSAIDLDGLFGLHPSLAPLKPLWDSRQLAIVHAAGSPDPTRSHFDAQDYMESGTPGLKATNDGWLNRALPPAQGQAIAGARREPRAHSSPLDARRQRSRRRRKPELIQCARRRRRQNPRSDVHGHRPTKS